MCRCVLGFLPVLIIVIAPCLCPAPAPAQDKPHPIFEKVKAKVKEPNKPFVMLVRLEVKEGAAAKFEAGFAPAIKATRQEKGCLVYDLTRDADNPNVYILIERWKTLADLDSHLRAEYIASLGAKLGDWLAAPPGLQVLVPAK